MSNWGEFNDDLLNTILSNLLGKDRLSFSLVCRHWNSVASTSPYRYSPCLTYYHQRSRAWRSYQFDAFSDSSFPELEKSDIRCSKYGWLLMSRHDGTLFFFDSSNIQTITLPCKVGPGYTSLTFFNPPTSTECVIVGIQTPIYKLGVGICMLRRGEDEWEIEEYPSNGVLNSFLVSLGAPVLHRGLIYILSSDGDVAILDTKRRHLDVYFKCLADKIGLKDQYLVKVKGEDDLFGVFVYFNDERKVVVCRLSSSSSDMKWNPVESIGDKVMYISRTSSFGDKARAKSMENTIYFPKFHGEVAVFYSLSEAKYCSLDGEYSEDNNRGLKRFDFAAWLTPMPALDFITTISWL